MKRAESEEERNFLQVSTVTESKPIPKGKISFEEFLEWCDEDTWAEWVDGEVILMAPASTRHQLINGFLYSVLGTYVRNRNLGVLLFAPFPMRLPFVRRGPEPDLLYIAAEHQDQLTDTYLDGPADVVVEIVSKESIDRDYNQKFEEYALEGVPEYWLIDPLKEKAMFYHLSEPGEYEPLPLEDGGIFRSQEISGFWLKVDWLWQMPPPDSLEVLQELLPDLQTEALRQAEMRFRQEAAARRREALARHQAEQRAQQAEQHAQQAEQRAQQEAQARHQVETELARLRAELEVLRTRSEEE